jgi:hypothetical protein
MMSNISGVNIKHFLILCKDTEIEVAAETKEEAMKIARLHIDKFNPEKTDIDEIYKTSEIN